MKISRNIKIIAMLLCSVIVSSVLTAAIIIHLQNRQLEAILKEYEQFRTEVAAINETQHYVEKQGSVVSSKQPICEFYNAISVPIYTNLTEVQHNIAFVRDVEGLKHMLREEAAAIAAANALEIDIFKMTNYEIVAYLDKRSGNPSTQFDLLHPTVWFDPNGCAHGCKDPMEKLYFATPDGSVYQMEDCSDLMNEDNLPQYYNSYTLGGCVGTTNRILQYKDLEAPSNKPE